LYYFCLLNYVVRLKYSKLIKTNLKLFSNDIIKENIILLKKLMLNFLDILVSEIIKVYYEYCYLKVKITIISTTKIDNE